MERKRKETTREQWGDTQQQFQREFDAGGGEKKVVVEEAVYRGDYSSGYEGGGGRGVQLK
jgi:hypothetical protein